ncbi:MAG: hypothetical protein HQL28_06950, partial [Candidatus Omnitrophica bacterium]|nr:hypothetical protein [Candidatus Omnitrophota bacterium]
ELKSASKKITAMKAVNLDRGQIDIAKGETPGLILFADDILNGAVVMDIEETLMKACAHDGALENGKVLLFCRDERNAVILDTLVKKAKIPVEIVIINAERLMKENAACRDNAEKPLSRDP